MPRPPKHSLVFCKTALEKLPLPTARRVDHYDQRIPGLAITVTPRGARSFYWIARVGRRTLRRRLGAFPRMTVEQARDAAQVLNGDVASGKPVTSRRSREVASLTLQELFERFLASTAQSRGKRERSPITVRTYRGLFSHALQDWESRALTDITRSDVERLHDRLASSSGPVYANRVLSLLKAMLAVAVDREWLAANVAARVRKFPERPRERFLQADELPRFWEALAADPSDDYRDFVKLALFTGQRRSNVLAMQWEEVDLAAGTWSMSRTKTGRHQVPLIAPALEILHRRRATADPGAAFVFPGHGRSGHMSPRWDAWRQLLERAGIANLTIHDLRRSMGSWQSKTGASLTVVGKTLGHTNPQTTAIYARLDDDPVRRAMTAAAAAMLTASQATTRTTPAPESDGAGG